MIRCLFLAAILALLGACTTVPKVQTQYSPTADFSDIKTFAVLPMPTQITGASPGVMVDLAEPAKAAIIADMEAKGYQLAPVESADIAVRLHGEMLPRTQVIDTGYIPQSYNDPWLNAYPNQPQQIVRTYDQGTLALEISQQGNLVWVGWSTKKRASGAAINTEKMIDGIHEILADFPPDKK